MKTDLHTFLTTLYVCLDDHGLPVLGWSRDRIRGCESVFGTLEGQSTLEQHGAQLATLRTP